MSKSIDIGSKPRPASAKRAEAWVQKKAEQIRITVDIPAELHTRIKAACASRRVTMSEELRVLLENAYPAEGDGVQENHKLTNPDLLKSGNPDDGPDDSFWGDG